MVFQDTLWPDFDRRDLWAAIETTPAATAATAAPSTAREHRVGRGAAPDPNRPAGRGMSDMPPASTEARTARETRGTRDTWDVIVIGGGPPGENAAHYAIRGTHRTAVIVENELVGGECSYWACIPSKTLLAPVELSDRARGLPGLATRVEYRASPSRRYSDDATSFTSHLDDSGQVTWAEGAGIDVLRSGRPPHRDRTVQVARPRARPATSARARR